MSRQASPFLPPSPEHVRVNSPVEFTQDYLFPSPPYDGHPTSLPDGRPQGNPRGLISQYCTVIDLFWCWSPRACHVKAEDFSLGERCHFAGLRGAEPSFTLSLRAHSTRGVASSQAF